MNPGSRFPEEENGNTDWWASDHNLRVFQEDPVDAAEKVRCDAWSLALDVVGPIWVRVVAFAVMRGTNRVVPRRVVPRSMVQQRRSVKLLRNRTEKSEDRRVDEEEVSFHQRRGQR